MFQQVVDKFNQNKAQVIRVGAAILGAAVGAVVAGAVLGSDEEQVLLESDTTAEETSEE